MASMELEFSGAINPSLKWKVSSKGRKRTERRPRTLFTEMIFKHFTVPRRIMPIRKASASKRPKLHEALDREGQKRTQCNKKKPTATSSTMSQSPTCKEPKRDISVSESEKLGAVLGKHFSGTEVSVPTMSHKQIISKYTEVSQDTIGEVPRRIMPIRKVSVSKKNYSHKQITVKHTEESQDTIGEVPRRIMPIRKVSVSKKNYAHKQITVKHTEVSQDTIGEVPRRIMPIRKASASKRPILHEALDCEGQKKTRCNRKKHIARSSKKSRAPTYKGPKWDASVTESEKLAVVLLIKRFRDAEIFVPIKKRRIFIGPSSTPLDGSANRTDFDQGHYAAHGNRNLNDIEQASHEVTDFSGLLLLASTARDTRFINDINNVKVLESPYVDVDIEVERGIYEEKIPNAEKSPPRMVDLVGAEDDLTNNSIDSKINGNNHASGSDGLENNSSEVVLRGGLDNNSSGEVVLRDGLDNNSSGEVVLRDCVYCGTDSHTSETGFVQAIEPGKVERLSNDDSEYEDGEIRDSVINGSGEAKVEGKTDRDAPKIRSDTQNVTQTVLQITSVTDLVGAEDDLTNKSICSKINGNNHASGSDGLDNNSSGEVVLRDCVYCGTDSHTSETGFVQAIEPGKVERLSNDDSEYEDGEIRDSVINGSGEEKVEGKTDRDAPKIRSDTQNVTQTVLQITSVVDISDSQRGKGIAGNQRLEDYRGFRDGINSGVDPPNRSPTPSRYNVSDVSKSISSTVVLGSRNYLSSQIERPMMSNDLNRKDGCYVKASRLDETIDRDFEFGDVNADGSFRRRIPSRSTPNMSQEDDWVDSRDHRIPVCHSSGYRDSHHFTPHRPRDASSGYRDPHHFTPHRPRDASVATAAYLERNGFVLAPDGTILSEGRSGSFGMEQGCDNLRGRSPYRSNDARWSRIDRDGHRVVWMRGRENRHAHGSNSEPTYRGGQSSSLPSGPLHLSRNYTRSPLRSSTPFSMRTSQRKSIDHRMDRSSSMGPRSRTPYLKSEAGEDSVRSRSPERARSVLGRPDFKSDRFKEPQCKRYSESRHHTPGFSQDQKFDQMQSPDKGYHLVRYGRFPGSDAVSREPRGHNLGNPWSHGDGCEVKNLTIQCDVDGAVEAVQKDVNMSKSCDV